MKKAVVALSVFISLIAWTGVQAQTITTDGDASDWDAFAGTPSYKTDAEFDHGANTLDILAYGAYAEDGVLKFVQVTNEDGKTHDTMSGFGWWQATMVDVDHSFIPRDRITESKLSGYSSVDYRDLSNGGSALAHDLDDQIGPELNNVFEGFDAWIERGGSDWGEGFNYWGSKCFGNPEGQGVGVNYNVGLDDNSWILGHEIVAKSGSNEGSASSSIGAWAESTNVLEAEVSIADILDKTLNTSWDGIHGLIDDNSTFHAAWWGVAFRAAGYDGSWTAADHSDSWIPVAIFNGDANEDGAVTIEDYSALTTAYGNTYTDPVEGWANGDFNFDGVVTIEDYSTLTTAYGNIRSVPEPVSMILLGLGGLGLIRRRK
jgi:hypothetical protein